jgi:hypothetical protein
VLRTSRRMGILSVSRNNGLEVRSTGERNNGLEVRSTGETSHNGGAAWRTGQANGH